MANALKKYPKAVFLFGSNDVETGTAVSLIETKSDIKILDKISINVYAGKSLKSDSWKAGIGIEKEIVGLKMFSIGGGYYMTKEVKNMFNGKSPINHSIGFSISGKF